MTEEQAKVYRKKLKENLTELKMYHQKRKEEMVEGLVLAGRERDFAERTISASIPFLYGKKLNTKNKIVEKLRELYLQDVLLVEGSLELDRVLDYAFPMVEAYKETTGKEHKALCVLLKKDIKTIREGKVPVYVEGRLDYVVSLLRSEGFAVSKRRNTITIREN